jgi:glycine/D-amino acid oxidase-like deaminating enzyme
VKPVKGQMILAGGTPDFCRHMILDGETYLIPRADGRIVVGSTLEDVGIRQDGDGRRGGRSSPRAAPGCCPSWDAAAW